MRNNALANPRRQRGSNRFNPLIPTDLTGTSTARVRYQDWNCSVSWSKVRKPANARLQEV